MSRAALTPTAAVLLGGAAAAWAAAAPGASGGWVGFVLFLVVLCVAASALRVGVAWIPLPEDRFLLSAPLRGWLAFLQAIRVPPWEEGAVIAALWLEVLHPARPWHTAVLGVTLTAYLLAVHLADSGASPGTLRPQAPVLAIGVGLLALGAGVGMLPAVSPGAGAAVLRVVAAIAAIAAAGLVLPYFGGTRS